MKGLIFGSIATLILEWVIQGFNLWTVLSIISTAMFCAKVVGYRCRLTHLFVCEGMGAFLMVMLQLLFNTFVLKETILVALTRLVFLGIATYDDKCFLYITEEHRKED